MINNQYSTVIVAQKERVYNIRYIEGIDEKQQHYTDVATDIVLDESTQHYRDHAWLREQAIQYVHDFGLGKVWMDSYQ